MRYIKRLIDDEIEFYLDVIGAILIMGPKGCGKTTTAERYAKSILKLQDTDKTSQYLRLADIKPSKLLEGKKPRLIDEWQEAPILWDAVRNSVDEIGEDALYILTSSSMVDESKIMHSGAGRIYRLLIRPMSLYESGESNGKIALMDLFNNPNLDIDDFKSSLTLEDLIFASCRGGWTASLNKKTRKEQLSIVHTYLDNLCSTEISQIDGIKRNPQRTKNILEAYARNISTNTKDTSILKDIKNNFEDISSTTYYSYVNALKKLFIIDNIKAWTPSIRSKSSMRSISKKLFIDPSISVAIQNLTPQHLEEDLNIFAPIFENLCIRDLLIYSSSASGSVSYYKDRFDLEADCVLHLRDGRYALIEFKLGSTEEEKGAKNLLKLNDLINEKHLENGMKKPSFLAIITGGEFAYTRKNGVKVIPIGCLR